MENAKEGIVKLVEKYNKIKRENKIKDYNEAQTLSEFIEPLFSYLGWDIHNIKNEKEVTPEENISGGRVDRAFRINSIVKFFLEAKSMRADLSVESYARQAIKYSWNKGVDYAVLTDFEEIKVFNASAKSKSLRDKIIFQISCEKYISDFEKLWILSKESFKKNKLDEYAESIFKKAQKLKVNEKLYDDLKKAREILTQAFGSWSENWKKGLDKELLDEGVQRILDRLIFIRVLEDRGLEEPMLRPLARAWGNWEIDRGKNGQLFHLLIDKFRELNDIYNSSLFKKHACEEWEEYSDAVKKAIDLLYGNDIDEYDFKEIPADILGGVYESYLGYIAQNPIEVDLDEKSGKLLKVEDKKDLKIKSRKKRKEQGIYYTPKFIVDYIVKNTLGEKLKETNSINDLKKIRILDPACGSGSFLTKALETMNDKYKDFSNPGDQSTKTEILLSNIYGVDLDSQAVELAKLNLLIDSLDRKEKLPDLKNIKVGNSLISGTKNELKKYFGKNWHDKKPFNWEEEFPEVFKQGGFDVIIGNPPWVSLKGKQKNLDFTEEEFDYFSKNFGSSNYRPNLFEMFIWRSLVLLKEGGLFSFIVPDRLCANQQFIKLREYILINCSIKELWFRVKFPGIIGDTVVFVIKKEKPINNEIFIAEYPLITFERIKQNKFLHSDDKALVHIPKEIFAIFEKIGKKSQKLESIVNSSVGFIAQSGKITQKQETKNQMEILKGENIVKYGNDGTFFFDFEKSNLAGGTQDKNKLGAPFKIFIRKTGSDVIATYGESSFYPEQSLYFLYGADKKTILALLGILNSKLINVYYKNYAVTNRDATPQLKKMDLDKFPIIIPNKIEKDYLVYLVTKILELNKQLQNISDNSDKWNSIKQEIEKNDKEINQKVYELYGLTEEEIKIVEN